MGIQGIEYARGHERLEELLGSIDRPGNYCVGGRLYLPMPRVVVDGVGELSFPVPRGQLKALIGAAERAPYGKGRRTLVDTSVRDCRQIDARNVRLLGRAWPDSLARIMDLVAEGLGLAAERLGAELYKLLIYPQGGFFEEHRDTEKVPGMVATLSLSLPAAGSGGEIVVRHGGRETTFDLTASEPSELSFAAFYADCLHEVLPVTDGHRVSLVFNLVLDSSRRGLGAPDYTDLAAPVTECLERWRDEGEFSKIVWLLEHEYSEEGLSFATLKNTDAAVAEVLHEAAERADCELFAAVLRIEEYGSPELEFDFGYDYRGDDEDDEDAVMGDVHDRWTALDGWAAPDGSQPALGEIPLHDSDLLPRGALADAEPDSRRIEGSTGNTGPTLELTYRLAALVLWPREKAAEIVMEGGIDSAVAWAATRITREPDPEDDGAQRILERLVELWPVEQHDCRRQNRAGMLRLLAVAGAAELAVDFLHHAVIAKYDGSENEALAEIMPMIGAEATGEFLVDLVCEQLVERPAVVIELLTLAEEVGDLTGEVDWRRALYRPLGFSLTGLQGAFKLAVKFRTEREEASRDHVLQWGSYLERDLDMDPDRPEPTREWIDDEAVRDLFLLARPHDLEAEAIQAARAVSDHPQIVTPGRMLPAALEGMHEDEELAGSAVYARLWRQAADFLLARSSSPPSEPSDWTIAADIPCDCEDCASLRGFCRDPAKRVERFSVRKDRRKHLHRVIDGYRLDVDHVTERSGSPYTLVCTKNRSGFRRRLREYAEDVRWMDSLRDCVPVRELGAASSGESGPPGKRSRGGKRGELSPPSLQPEGRCAGECSCASTGSLLDRGQLRPHVGEQLADERKGAVSIDRLDPPVDSLVAKLHCKRRVPGEAAEALDVRRIRAAIPKLVQQSLEAMREFVKPAQDCDPCLERLLRGLLQVETERLVRSVIG